MSLCSSFDNGENAKSEPLGSAFSSKKRVFPLIFPLLFKPHICQVVLSDVPSYIEFHFPSCIRTRYIHISSFYTIHVENERLHRMISSYLEYIRNQIFGVSTLR